MVKKAVNTTVCPAPAPLPCGAQAAVEWVMLHEIQTADDWQSQAEAGIQTQLV